MALKIAIFDGLVPVIDFIAQRHIGLAREALSVTGSKLAKQARNDIKQYSHYWQQKVENGKRTIYKDTTPSRVLGTVTERGGKKLLNHENVGEMISFYMPEMDSPSALSVTVAGSHPAFNPIKYDKGLAVGKLARVKSINKVTRSIFHKLNTGTLDKYHPYNNNHVGFESTSMKYVARPFMDNALHNAKSEILSSLDKRYKKIMPTIVNNTNLTIKEIRA